MGSYCNTKHLRKIFFVDLVNLVLAYSAFPPFVSQIQAGITAGGKKDSPERRPIYSVF